MISNIPCVGDRIRLLAMPDDPDPVPAGTCGVITDVHAHSDWMQIEVEWDNGRKLMLTVPPDRFEKIDTR
jgi:Domain of unknown function (DUF4314)